VGLSAITTSTRAQAPLSKASYHHQGLAPVVMRAAAHAAHSLAQPRGWFAASPPCSIALRSSACRRGGKAATALGDGSSGPGSVDGRGGDAGGSNTPGGNLASAATQFKPPLAPPTATLGKPRRIPHAAGEGAGAVAAAAAEEVPAGAVQAESAVPWGGVVALAATAAMICSIDRAAMSVAILPMAQQFDWSDTIKGEINGLFFMGGCKCRGLGAGLMVRQGSGACWIKR
jgi:hypothetical protein